MKKIVVAAIAIALLVSPVANAKKKTTKKRQGAERCITAEADAVFDALRPLTKSCSRVGPASARWYVTGSVWNGLTHDQQYQLMNQVASRQAIQDARVTIHLYVYSTDVGEIGPGWTGEWKFRRNDD
jgi:hypothetical protein